MLTRLFAYVIFSAAFGAMLGIALRALATAWGWSGGKGKGIRRLEAVVICITAGCWLLSAPVIVPIGTDLLTAGGMEEDNAFTLMVAIVVPVNALLGVAFGWIIGPEPGPKPSGAHSHFVPFADERPVAPSGVQPPVESVAVPFPAEPSLAIPDDPPEAIPAPADDTGPSPFASMGRQRSEEELWSSYGRDAFFLSILSLLLLGSACIVPLFGVLLAGIMGLITLVIAIRAIIVAGSRSSRGLALAIVALVISLIPFGLASVFLLGMILSGLRW
jgi:hypothetical protein